MEVLRFSGLDPALFSWVAPLVMNPSVLRFNNNYPFKTTERFRWYVAVEKKRVTGFLPVEQRNGTRIINNYYIKDDGLEVLRALLDAVGETGNIQAVVQVKHEAMFAKCGFRVSHQWTNYIRMAGAGGRI